MTWLRSALGSLKRLNGKRVAAVSSANTKTLHDLIINSVSEQKALITSTSTSTPSEDTTTQNSATATNSVEPQNASQNDQQQQQNADEQMTSSTEEPKGRARARQLNMERFYRLSRRPELMNALSGNRHRSAKKKGRPVTEVTDLSKDIANLPPHVAALVNGVDIVKRPVEEQPKEKTNEESPKEHEKKEPQKQTNDGTEMSVVFFSILQYHFQFLQPQNVKTSFDD